MQASVYEKHGKHQQPTVLVVFAFHLAKALTVVQDEVLLWLHIASSLACVSTLPHLGAGLSLLSCMAPIAFPWIWVTTCTKCRMGRLGRASGTAKLLTLCGEELEFIFW